MYGKQHKAIMTALKQPRQMLQATWGHQPNTRIDWDPAAQHEASEDALCNDGREPRLVNPPELVAPLEGCLSSKFANMRHA
jgi:hypothetical protein